MFSVLGQRMHLYVVGVVVVMLVAGYLLKSRQEEVVESWAKRMMKKVGCGCGKENFASLDQFDATNNILKLDTKKCSRKCCKHVQWKPPHMSEPDADGNVASNFMCNLGEGGGCVCMGDEDMDYLSKRGGNAY